MHPSRKMVSWISVVSGSAWTHSAATKNQLQQRREFTADLDTKPGDKTIDGAASLVRKTCEKMTSWKLETLIQTVPFQFISTLICLIMFDIQGGDIPGGHLSDAWRTCVIYTYIHISISHEIQTETIWLYITNYNALLLQSSNFECLKFHQISSSNVPKEKFYPCCLWVGRWWSCSWFQLWKSPAWDGQQPYASLLGGAYPSNIRKKKKARHKKSMEQ